MREIRRRAILQTMSDEPTPENNLILRQMAGMRRDMAEIMEREARVVELLGRMNGRLDEFAGRVDLRLNEMRSDLILMENRILTAITEVRLIAARLDAASEEADA